jgi:L-lactate dehydrogenase complex protein LldF
MPGPTLGGFKARADAALKDPNLRIAIDRTTRTARQKREAAVADWPGFSKARDLGRRVKDHVIENLDYYLAAFERNARASGAVVHYAATADEACQIVIGICRDAKAQTVTRSKSMLGEEIGLPHALDEAGLTRVETDLAEHIVQLAHDRPSHIIWPALHHKREDIAALFREHHHSPQNSDDVGAMVASARRRADDDHSAHPYRDGGNRKTCAEPAARLHAAAPSGAIGDRIRHYPIYDLPLRPRAGGGC